MIYDTLICNATIIDGSNSAPFNAEVAIRDGMLTLLPEGSAPPATHAIDGEGLFLAPGFIDVHTHDDTNVIKAPHMFAKISQGVTTVITGNCGISAAGARLKTAPPDPMNLLGEQKDFRYPTFAAYARAVELARPNVNVAALVGHTTLRNNVMDDLLRTATDEEINEMRQQLRQALQQGALGLSSGLAYGSANAASTAEIVTLVGEMANTGGIYTSHLRTEFDGILEAMDEAFATAKHGKVPLVVSHLKCAGAGNWGRSGEILQHLQRASTAHPIACDCYPYTASSSTLDLKQVTADNDIFITWSTPHPEQSGNMLADIASDWQLSLEETAKKLMPAGAVYHCMHDDDVENILAWPHTMIGSDGLPNDPHPHPRLWGAFPRVIGHYARQRGLFSIATAIHKMTGLSASRFQLEKRGLIANGYHADLVLFNAETIRDTATWEKPVQAAEGIEKVWVNGVLSFSDQQPLEARAGQFLYRKN